MSQVFRYTIVLQSVVGNEVKHAQRLNEYDKTIEKNQSYFIVKC